MFNNIMNELVDSLLNTFEQMAEDLCDAHDSGESPLEAATVEKEKSIGNEIP